MCRLTVLLSDPQSEELQRLAGELDDSQTGVIRQALVLLRHVLNERKAGNTLAIARGDKVLREIVPLWNQPAA